MATTTNYGWTTPDDTALVKDGASAIRSLGTSVDTTTKNLNPSTTLGDIEYRSSTANTNTRLGIGSTGQILTVAGGVPSWATPGGSNQNFSLLNAGGTSLVSSPAASSKTITGLSGYNQFYILVHQVSAVANTVQIQFQLNGDSGSNYLFAGNSQTPSAGYDYQIFTSASSTGTTELSFGRTSATDTGYVSAGLHIYGANSSGNKVCAWNGGGNNNDNNFITANRNGVYTGTSVISSITIFTNTGSNIDNGTIYIWASA